MAIPTGEGGSPCKLGHAPIIFAAKTVKGVWGKSFSEFRAKKPRVPESGTLGNQGKH